MKLTILAVTALSLGIMSGVALADAAAPSQGQGFSPEINASTYVVEGVAATHSINGFVQKGFSFQCEQEASRGSTASANC